MSHQLDTNNAVCSYQVLDKDGVNMANAEIFVFDNGTLLYSDNVDGDEIIDISDALKLVPELRNEKAVKHLL